MVNVWSGLTGEYRNRPSLEPGDPIATLFEGNTPLVRASRLEERVALASEAVGVDASSTRIYVKFEGTNPTGPFRDRGMTTVMARAKVVGTQMVACASIGNTSASATAYAMTAGVEYAAVFPAGKIVLGKLTQVVMHEARLVAVDGNFDDCLCITWELTERYPAAPVNPINPYRLQGQKTAVFEACDVLGDALDIHVLPVGSADNISAYWMGYNEYSGHRAAPSVEDSAMKLRPQSTKASRMRGIQAEGAVPFTAGKPAENPETVATAIHIGNPASWDYAVVARDDSQGLVTAVSDMVITEAQVVLAAEAGVFCESVLAASVAGLLALIAKGKVPTGAKIVCTLIGNGFKDIAIAMENRGNIAPQVTAPELGAAATVLGL